VWAGVGDWGLALSMYILFEHSQCRCLFRRVMPIIGQRKYGREEESARGGRAERGQGRDEDVPSSVRGREIGESRRVGRRRVGGKGAVRGKFGV
jgi:hypothetical protein